MNCVVGFVATLCYETKMGSRGSIFALLLLSCIAFNFVNGNEVEQIGSDEKIVGGFVARKKVLRHLVKLYIETKNSGFSCTGSVIGRRYILSAAHCFPGIKSNYADFLEYSSLYIGQKDANPSGDAGSYGFESIYIHKKYKDNAGLPYDVAIVELTEDIQSKSYYPIKLGKEPAEDKRAVVAGYGVLNEEGDEPKYAMQTNVIAKSFKTCKSSEAPAFRNTVKKKIHICAVSLGFPDEGRTDSCYGDSGGPLMRKAGNKYVQYGITSFAYTGCAEAGGIQWYARVHGFKRDIKKIIKGKSSSKFVQYTD